MAKSKRKSGQLGLYLTIAILVVAVLGVALFLFLDAVVIKKLQSSGGDGIFDQIIGNITDAINDILSNGTPFTGMQIVFGYSNTTEVFGQPIVTEILQFSFVALIPLILMVAGVILNIPKSKLFGLIGVICFIAAAVMFVFTPNYVWFAGADSMGVADYYQAGVGSYLGLACSALCALLGLGRLAVVK